LLEQWQRAKEFKMKYLEEGDEKNASTAETWLQIFNSMKAKQINYNAFLKSNKMLLCIWHIYTHLMHFLYNE
jgi:hypothetical protein